MESGGGGSCWTPTMGRTTGLETWPRDPQAMQRVRSSPCSQKVPRSLGRYTPVIDQIVFFKIPPLKP